MDTCKVHNCVVCIKLSDPLFIDMSNFTTYYNAVGQCVEPKQAKQAAVSLVKFNQMLDL